MLISGYQQITLKDYPHKLAAICFTQGCQLKCPYCHNPDLVIANATDNGADKNKIADNFFSYVKERKKLLDGVVISGGEPLLHPDLNHLCVQLKESGLAIKLDTNGLMPEHLKDLIDNKLIDYVALDYKVSSKNWRYVSGTDKASANATLYSKWKESLTILDQENIAYELRTTIVQEFHPLEELIQMANELQSIISKTQPEWFLQNFVRSGPILADFCPDNISLTAYKNEELHKLVNSLKPLVTGVKIRN